jgi:hypothetical protein
VYRHSLRPSGLNHYPGLDLLLFGGSMSNRDATQGGVRGSLEG